MPKRKKNLIERAYREGEPLGLAVWTQDEAGPYPTRPMPGQSWAERGQAQRQPHEYVRNGTAKLLTLFCPGSGQLRARGVTAAPNAVLHPWLQQELTAVLDHLPAAPALDAARNHAVWEQWQKGLKKRITLPAILPALRLLLVWDNLAGHLTPALVLWLFAHGVMPLYTPLSGSWLNMAESIQRIISRRALAGQYLQTPQQIIEALEATVKGLAPGPDAFSLGRQTPCAPFAQPATPTRPGGLGRLHTPCAAASAIGTAKITIGLPSDPLVDTKHG